VDAISHCFRKSILDLFRPSHLDVQLLDDGSNRRSPIQQTVRVRNVSMKSV
jgi:hypothetical protein